MELENAQPEILWRYYQRGYYSLVSSGLYFRQVLRPALSHVYFQRAMPLLVEYARANHTNGDLPPGFSDQMEACPLTPRDLLHLDYAICLGYAEQQGLDPSLLSLLPVLDWPGPGGSNGLFIAADAQGSEDPFIELVDEDPFGGDDEDDENGDTGEHKKPFDL